MEKQTIWTRRRRTWPKTFRISPTFLNSTKLAPTANVSSTLFNISQFVCLAHSNDVESLLKFADMVRAVRMADDETITEKPNRRSVNSTPSRIPLAVMSGMDYLRVGFEKDCTTTKRLYVWEFCTKLIIDFLKLTSQSLGFTTTF